MQGMLKQMQKMQGEMGKVQDGLENEIVEGTSGGEMVKVKANGKGTILSIKLNPEVVDKDDVEMLEDLILTAVNSAAEKAAALSDDKMGALTVVMDIPGLT